MSKKPRFRTLFDSQLGKESQTMLKFARQHFYQIFLSLRGNWSEKIYLLAITEFLGLFVNKLTADDKYSLRNSDNLWQPIQMQLSKKNIFLNFFLSNF